MSLTNEHFLFCVLDNTVSGKTDWKAVGDVFGIKVGAASMRFTRLKAKFSNYADVVGGSSSKSPSQQQTPKKKAAATKFTPSKKRKTHADEDVDDHEVPASNGEVKVVKEEAGAKEESEDDGWAY